MHKNTEVNFINNSFGMVLSELLKPATLDDIAGQKHILGKNGVLRKIIETGTFDSLIFVGPPGVGKTSAAKIAGNMYNMPFYSLHATTAGAGDLKKISDMAGAAGIAVLVFIDEIHRYNKSQQNLLLKLLDDKFVKLVGASTENPVYSLVPALRSRSLIFNFNKLSDDDLISIAEKAIPIIKEKYNVDDVVYTNVIDEIIRQSSSDARRFINTLELAVMLGIRENGKLILSMDGLEELVKKKMFDDDEYYDLISAMIKSIRGSDPDAALLWGLKIIKSGVEPEAVFRRLLISASEDIGNAYPDALVFINSAYDAFMKTGLPEGMIILSQAITYLAACPKSNKSYLALKACEKYLEEYDPQVPSNIRHSPEKYLYPHDFGGFVYQVYKPDNANFYSPSQNGFEQKIAERMQRLWKQNKKNGNHNE